MSHCSLRSTRSLCGGAAAALLAMGGAGLQAQEAAPSPSPTPGGGLRAEPGPYYIGASQAFIHDSNVFRVPFGPSDNLSSTSLLGGFDQPFSRQRVFGSASVSANRYQDQTDLNNTSYSLLTGLDWATIWRLSGNVTATLDQSLAAPAATAASPEATRNVQKRKGLSGLARWGGGAAFTAEGRLGYSSQSYSGKQSQSSNSNNEYASLGGFYNPGQTLQLGVAARFDRTRSPYQLRLADGSSQGNETRGKNLDFLANYNNGSSITAAGRLSYTRQTNSSVAQGADFSGLTGSLSLGYRLTGKIALNFGASRDAGYNAQAGLYLPVVVTTTPATPTPVPANTTATLYENNQVTNSLSLGASYAATAKVGLTAGARYSRARIVTSARATGSGSSLDGDVRDETRQVTLGVSYAFSRALNLACNLSRERRSVSGVISYRYTDDIGACSAQFLWR